jgi:hypothetical protein
VKIVERQIEIPRPVTPTRRDWPELLEELGRQLDDGRIYDRDLRDLGAALMDVWQAFDRRPFVVDRAAPRRPI